ncbi:MAG: hypothetical protein DRH21_04495 [Deltaproteobacteria bacterium]|nr:MAG: hypothetical protein DRH21_04495 [Deltaproteobacteria bacterium]
MKQLVLNIEESELTAFLNYIKTLDYVSVTSEEFIEIPKWQQDEVENRLQLIKTGEMKARSWSKAKQDIFKK